jgi:hypothetical protein
MSSFLLFAKKTFAMSQLAFSPAFIITQLSQFKIVPLKKFVIQVHKIVFNVLSNL